MKRFTLKAAPVILLLGAGVWLFSGCGGSSQPGKGNPSDTTASAEHKHKHGNGSGDGDGCNCDTTCYTAINCNNTTCQDFIVARHNIRAADFKSRISTEDPTPTNYFVADIKKMMDQLNCEMGDYIGYTVSGDSMVLYPVPMEFEAATLAKHKSKKTPPGGVGEGKISLAFFTGWFRMHKSTDNDIVAVYLLNNPEEAAADQSAGLELLRNRLPIAFSDMTYEYP